MSYGPRQTDAYRRAGVYAGWILKRRDSTSAILVDAEIKKTDSPGGLRAPDGARVMIQRGSDPDAQVRRILDALKVTPERFLDFHQGVVVRDAVFTVADKINPDLIRPSKIPRPFKWLWRINLDTFDEALRKTLDPKSVGYCYMLKRKGKLVYLRSSGWAQLPNDGSVGWDAHVPMNVGSVSKFITAIATIRLLRESNISLNTLIVDFLPQYWTIGSGVGTITFHDLLRHESGLGGSLNVDGKLNTNSGPGDFATAKDQIGIGSTVTGTYDYKNVNFAVLRVLFATLTGTLDPAFNNGFLSISKDTLWDFVSATAYCNYVNDNLFEAASIAPREFKADDIAAKAYGTPPTAPGSRVEDDIANAGPTGWQLSIGELTRLLGEFRRGGSILSSWWAERLLSNLYGLDEMISTSVGPVYRKNGRTVLGMQTMDSAIYLMPNDVEFAIFVNSGPGTTPTDPTYLEPVTDLIQSSIEFNI
jgi:Beta-lactamase